MKVVITGITGQDGSFMADYLLKNTQALIYGIVRQLSVPNHKNIEHLKNNPRVFLIEGDITCPHSMSGIVKKIQPDYFINFAANSFVKTSWENPTQVVETNTLSVMHQLEAIRKECPTCRYYQAGSSEEFGDVIYSPQDEKHPLRPRSPYGASKAGARHLVKVYRDSYHLYAVAGWLFNHEGTRRGEQFVTRKITKGVSRIARIMRLYEAGIEGVSPRELAIQPIRLGNLMARRDWSDAEDFMDGVWRMLNQEKYNPKFTVPQDYVLASGETHTIGEFVEAAFKAADIKVSLLNGTSPINEKGQLDLDSDRWDHSLDTYYIRTEPMSWVPVVTVDGAFCRPADVELLCGDANRARVELQWRPKNTFQQLVQKMVDYDLMYS